MRSSFPKALAGLVCLLALALLPAAVALGQPEVGRDGGDGDVATFVLTSGETYPDVAYEVDQRFKTIKLLLPGGERQVSFTAIAGITAGGRDVTEQIIGRRSGAPSAPATAAEGGEEAGAETATPPAAPQGAPAAGPEAAPGAPAAPPPPAKTWLSENDEAYKAAHASPWSVGLRLAANYSVPVGDYYDGVKSGIGYEGDLLIGLTRKIALRMSASRSGAKWDDDMHLVLDDPAAVVLKDDLSLAIWRFSLAAQYHGRLQKDRDDGSLAYVYAGLGVAVHNLDAEVTWLDTGDDLVYTGSDSDSQTKLMTSLGGGLTAMVGPRIGVDLSAEVDVIFVGTTSETYSYYGVAETALLVDGKLGLVYFF